MNGNKTFFHQPFTGFSWEYSFNKKKKKKKKNKKKRKHKRKNSFLFLREGHSVGAKSLILCHQPFYMMLVYFKQLKKTFDCQMFWNDVAFNLTFIIHLNNNVLRRNSAPSPTHKRLDISSPPHQTGCELLQKEYFWPESLYFLKRWANN